MKQNIKELFKFKTINKLKLIERLSSVGARKESSAEHTWSAIILADYYLNKTALKLDRTKIYELLMYHDLIEIYAGDTPLHPEMDKDNQKKINKELAAAKRLKDELPEEISEKFYSLFIEFENAKSEEAKFAKAIDALDSQIHEIDYKEDWRGWTKEFLISKKISEFENFPEIKQDFLDLCEYLEEEGYFSE